MSDSTRKPGRGKRSRRLTPVTSLADLRHRCESDPRYQRLALDAAENLGQPIDRGPDGWKGALQSLYLCAASLEAEYGHVDGEGVTVDEVNFVVDMSNEEDRRRERRGGAR